MRLPLTQNCPKYCLIAINLITTPGGYFWAIWPMLGWGLGLGFHAAGTFFPNERKLDRHVQRRHCTGQKINY